MFYHKEIFIILFLFLLIFNGCNKIDATSPDSSEVLDREQERIEYLASKSYNQLSDMLSASMSYTHSNAIIENKEEYLEQLRSGRVVYHDMNHQDLDIRFVNPTTAIITGISDVSVTVDGEDQEVPLRFTLVYEKVDDVWIFEAWHSVGRP